MFFNLFKKPKIIVHAGEVNPIVLIILDGWGMAPPSDGNAITQAKLPNYNYYLQNFPHSQLLASGESVGLPANEVGNTEVGHLNIGAGRIILQDLKRIDKSVEDAISAAMNAASAFDDEEEINNVEPEAEPEGQV